MKKRIIAALAASFALMALASTAEAAITITQAPAGPGYQNLSPWTCNGKTFYLTPHYFDPDPNTGIANQVPGSGLPIRLGFGWGALQVKQIQQFFQSENGSVSIVGTAPGSDTFSDSWGATADGSSPISTQGIAWSPIVSQQVSATGNPPYKNGYASFYRGVLSIAPGTYTLTVDYHLTRAVNDGFGASGPGDITGSCTFTVAA
jgi:hypothetical protein